MIIFNIIYCWTIWWYHPMIGGRPHNAKACGAVCPVITFFCLIVLYLILTYFFFYDKIETNKSASSSPMREWFFYVPYLR